MRGEMARMSRYAAAGVYHGGASMARGDDRCCELERHAARYDTGAAMSASYTRVFRLVIIR